MEGRKGEWREWNKNAYIHAGRCMHRYGIDNMVKDR